MWFAKIFDLHPLDGSTRGHKRAGVAYMDGAGGVPSVRRPGKGREQEWKLEGVLLDFTRVISALTLPN